MTINTCIAPQIEEYWREELTPADVQEHFAQQIEPLLMLGSVAVVIDIETTSSTDFQVGLATYLQGQPKLTCATVSIQLLKWDTPSGTPEVDWELATHTFDFTTIDSDWDIHLFRLLLRYVSSPENAGKYPNFLVAHNAEFEESILRLYMEEDIQDAVWLDTAVWARAYGFDGRLSQTLRQLDAQQNKLETGGNLIRMFSIEGWQFCEGHIACTNCRAPIMVAQPNAWMDFLAYNKQDVLVTVELLKQLFALIGATQTGGSLETEIQYHTLVRRMNRTGWHVDQELLQLLIDRTRMIQDTAKDHYEAMRQEYRTEHSIQLPENIMSPAQLVDFCANELQLTHIRKATKDVLKELLDKVSGKDRDQFAAVHQLTEAQMQALELVLTTRLTLAHSSLKKLDVFKKAMDEDGQLKYNYTHIGASQTWRTTATGVQVQNLPRLKPDTPMIGETDYEPVADLETADDIAHSLRQVLTATPGTSEHGSQLVVGDFSSIESRALALLSGAAWKLEAFREGKDMYKVQAARIFKVPYEEVDKQQRQIGKVAELGCGYGAGGAALANFAAGMGVDLSLQAAQELVRDWRAANPEVVQLWRDLEDTLAQVVLNKAASASLKLPAPLRGRIYFTDVNQSGPTPVVAGHSSFPINSKSIALTVDLGKHRFTRMFHGVHVKGNQICYARPGTAWSNPWLLESKLPGSLRSAPYTLYGGKLTGILTQSFCRELFFYILAALDTHLQQHRADEAKVIGQFHDEIIVEVQPKSIATVAQIQNRMQEIMTQVPPFMRGLPMDAEVHAAFRYIK